MFENRNFFLSVRVLPRFRRRFLGAAWQLDLVLYSGKFGRKRTKSSAFYLVLRRL